VTDLEEALTESSPVLLRAQVPPERAKLRHHLLGEATALVELYCGISPASGTE
jgi:hypothetical protein